MSLANHGYLGSKEIEETMRKMEGVQSYWKSMTRECSERIQQISGQLEAISSVWLLVSIISCATGQGT